ncbi:variable surface protein [Plasmodium gonderi]|uniref:Variable surface protein n=1 Tax=Plasmodium gonderi TaxID=77519 RepID=A0A1Y1JT45_PLAGO|nr:variable surface protein [Plasmodium gonderi]GAW83952.1 variable surface protein [Plasmodium gonderi]
MGRKNIQNIIKAYLENDKLGLPSAKFYKNLDRHLLNYYNDNRKLKQNELKVYHDKCELYKTKYRSDLYINLCSVVLWYLSTENTIIIEPKSYYNNCELLNYWTYSRLSWIYNRKSAPITTMFANLQMLWNSLVEDSVHSSSYNKCSPKFEIIYQRNSIKRKELYDYCIDYKTLLSSAEYYKDMRDIIYQYFTRKVKLYEEFKTYCSNENKHECPEFFDECKDSDPSVAITKIKYYIEQKKIIPGNSAVRSQDTFPDNTSTESEPSSKDQSGAIDVKTPDGHSISLFELSPVNDSLLTVYEAEQLADLFINPDRSSIISILGKMFLGLILFTILSSILYKFTPIGIRLRKIFGQKKNISDVYKSKNRLFDYSSESCNPNYMNGKEHFVGYHPE